MKKILYTLVIISFFAFIPKVKASEMFFGVNGAIYVYNGSTYYIKIDGTNNNVPKSLYPTASQDMNLGVIDMYFSPASGNINVLDTFNYNYLIIDGCSTGNLSFVISNSSCGNSCVATGTYNRVTAGTCTVDGYAGYRSLYQIPIQKWYLNTVSEMLETSSYIHLVNNDSSARRIRINSIFLTDEDYTLVYQNQQELVNKLDSVNTSITNMQNSINSNIDSESTAIQNKIDAAKNQAHQDAQQAHTDAQTTQNKIDSLKDDTVNSNTGKSFFDNFSDNSHGLSGIITAPLNIIRQLINVNPTSCSALSTTYHNKTISMPCGAIFWGHTGFSQFNTFYNMVVGGAFCYLIIKDLFLTIEKLKDPDNDKVEVMDL